MPRLRKQTSKHTEHHNMRATEIRSPQNRSLIVPFWNCQQYGSITSNKLVFQLRNQRELISK
jgi:hypothetical protein